MLGGTSTRQRKKGKREPRPCKDVAVSSTNFTTPARSGSCAEAIKSMEAIALKYVPKQLVQHIDYTKPTLFTVTENRKLYAISNVWLWRSQCRSLLFLTLRKPMNINEIKDLITALTSLVQVSFTNQSDELILRHEYSSTASAAPLIAPCGRERACTEPNSSRVCLQTEAVYSAIAEGDVVESPYWCGLI